MSVPVTTLEDFARDVDVTHPLTARRVAVLRPGRGGENRGLYVAVEVGEVCGDPEAVALEPTQREGAQLGVFLDRRLRDLRPSYRALLQERGPFDHESLVATYVFRHHSVHGWQYRLSTWERGPAWCPMPSFHSPSSLTLEELLDRVTTIGAGARPPQVWLDMKAASGAFDATQDEDG